MAKDMEKIQFEEIDEKDLFAVKEYTKTCSGNVSDCCTKVCSGGCQNGIDLATEEEWGQFLNIEGGVVQY